MCHRRVVDDRHRLGARPRVRLADELDDVDLSSSRRAVPTSKREISSRSSTSCLKRSRSLDSRSTAVCARSGSSSDARLEHGSTEAVNVISGERSSWLTSDAKRASRSTRSCSAPAISLNDAASDARSRSAGGTRRVSRLPAGDRLGGGRDVTQRPHHARARPRCRRIAAMPAVAQPPPPTRMIRAATAVCPRCRRAGRRS